MIDARHLDRFPLNQKFGKFRVERRMERNIPEQTSRIFRISREVVLAFRKIGTTEITVLFERKFGFQYLSVVIPRNFRPKLNGTVRSNCACIIDRKISRFTLVFAM